MAYHLASFLGGFRPLPRTNPLVRLCLCVCVCVCVNITTNAYHLASLKYQHELSGCHGEAVKAKNV